MCKLRIGQTQVAALTTPEFDGIFQESDRWSQLHGVLNRSLHSHVARPEHRRDRLLSQYGLHQEGNQRRKDERSECSRNGGTGAQYVGAIRSVTYGAGMARDGWRKRLTSKTLVSAATEYRN
jgi:hypothetical protein